ncbi:MAG TPA: pirin family protein [Propionibacteriaceae bacterium]
MRPIVDVRRAGTRFVTRTDWLESRHCFSFGEHYDPDNVGHGAMLVSNDELVQAGAGFDDHPHRDAEIVTWVLSGSLVHEDSAGHRGVIYPGMAQRMSAGRGIVHAERNDAYRIDPEEPAEPVRFIQMWLRPDEPGLDPSYQQRELDLAGLAGSWAPVASGRDLDAAVTVATRDASLWVTRLAPGTTRVLPEAPLLHLYVARGAVHLEGSGTLAEGDSVRITGVASLDVTGMSTQKAGDHAELLVWGMGA